MKRRTFLQGALAGAAMTPVLLDRLYALPSSPANRFTHLLPMDYSDNGKVLIYVQMFGGNDGLNTVIPADNPDYKKLRPTIYIAPTSCYTFGGIYMNPGLAVQGGNGMKGFGTLF